MSTAGRLVGFAALLAVVFAGAALLGGAIKPGTIGDEAAGASSSPGHSSAAGHGGQNFSSGAPTSAKPQTVRGLAVSDSGLTLELVGRALPRGQTSRLAFRITGRDGKPWTRFEVEHEKRLHLIVVRRDGRGFQHLHPEMASDGVWSTPIRLDEAGAYRVFADFTTGGRALTLAEDLTVDGAADYRDLPSPAAAVRTTDGAYEVRLVAGRTAAGNPAELRFAVTRGGVAVGTEPYLGAGGHLVALRRGDLAYLHTHPADHEAGASERDDAVEFESTFPTAGAFRLYFQFKHAGQVRTAEFTQEITR